MIHSRVPFLGIESPFWNIGACVVNHTSAATVQKLHAFIKWMVEVDGSTHPFIQEDKASKLTKNDGASIASGKIGTDASSKFFVKTFF